MNLLPINPAAKINNSANHSIANNTSTEVVMNTLEFESHDGMWDAANKLYAPEPGIYLAIGHLKFANNGTGVRQMQIRKNGSQPRACEVRQKADSADQNAVTLSALIDMQPGDYVSCYVYQSSGGALNIVADGAGLPDLAITKVSDLNVP